jgi:hypothetical protein
MHHVRAEMFRKNFRLQITNNIHILYLLTTALTFSRSELKYHVVYSKQLQKLRNNTLPSIPTVKMEAVCSSDVPEYTVS